MMYRATHQETAQESPGVASSHAPNSKLSRRMFLSASIAVGGGLALSVAFRSWAAPGGVAEAAAAAAQEIGPWLTITPDNRVQLRIPLPESGNGVATFAAKVITEELHCDWDAVEIAPVPLNRDARESLYHILDGTIFAFAGRSTEHRLLRVLQQVGASARERLKQAAAARWNVPAAEIQAERGVLSHPASSRAARYGEVASEAARVELANEPQIKQPSEWTFLGANIGGKLADAQIVNGRAVYGIDVQVGGMLYGAVRQSPVHGGTLQRHDFDAIRHMPGVVGIAVVDPSGPRPKLKKPMEDERDLPQSAVIVVAEHYWQARQALDALPLEWNAGNGAQWKTTKQVNEAALALLDRDGAKIDKDDGDALKALSEKEDAGQLIEATYLTPYADQAPIEPLNATALVTKDRVDVWHNGSILAQSFIVAAEEAGVAPDRVHLHSTMIGGSFGRRNFADDLRLVVAAAKQFPGRPIKVIWSREEMMRQGRYRWLTAGRLRARLAEDGTLHALHARVTNPGYGMAGLNNVPLVNGLLPNVRIESHELPIHILWGSYRAPGYNSYAFFLESFVDECAHAVGVDPLAYREKLLEKCPDPGWLGCLREVAKQAQWGKPLPRGQAQGIAISNWGNWATPGPQAGTTVAAIAHVDVSRAGQLRVLQLDLAFDCGRVIDPDTVRAQLEGGAIFGLNMCLNEALNIEDGRIVEGNFDAYPMLRMADIPKINIHFGALSQHQRFAEVGEPPVGPIGPAVANAIFRATGKRIRSMPFREHDLRWS
jgi:isoquinoline 1-oxidoreductase beta subunit